VVKFTKIFRVLASVGIISLLAIAITATPALAVERITLEDNEGRIGDRLDISGDGFSEDNVIYIYFSDEEFDEGDDVDDLDSFERVKTTATPGPEDPDPQDEFDTSFTVPDRLEDGDVEVEVRGGDYWIYVTETSQGEILAKEDFRVIAGMIDLSPEEGAVGTEVDISGDEFSGREEFTIDYDGFELDSDYIDDNCDEDTDSGGRFDCTILIPPSTAGAHTVFVTDETGPGAEATFTVEPEIDINVTSGIPGDRVTITGTGFGEDVSLDITLDGRGANIVADDDNTDNEGSFVATIEVPEVDEGTYDIEVEDDDRNRAQAQFMVDISTEISINPVTSLAAPGNVGQNVTISGAGFNPNSTITITYTSHPITVATTTSNADGDFLATFQVPQSEHGPHTIDASDGTNTLTVPFYVETNAPPVPEPLLPEEDSRAEGMAHFDWTSVNDDSPPVTYTLEVAYDEAFTTMVLEVSELTSSEYTVPDGSELEPTEADESYYWRVRATDGASNESNWSTVSSFTVGGGLGLSSLPPWITHLWWGLGVVGAIFFGYWLGKRRAYYY
jgi:hypothetical protein